jgi:integrase
MELAQYRSKSTKIDLRGSKLVAKRFHFTKKTIDALPLPRVAQRAYFYDDQVRGLAIAVAPSGRRTFLLYRKVSGKPERISIGPYPDLSIDQARKRAEELNGAIASGKNPATEKRRIRAESTLGELLDAFVELYGKPNKRRWREDVAAFNRYLSHWRNRKISTITRGDVQALHARLGQKHRYTANRTIELLCAMYNRARADYGFDGENPAAGIKSFRERKRSRFLEGHELPAFFQSLAEEPNDIIKDFLLVALLTGARRRNVQSLEWSEIDWRRAVWKIPPEKAKGDEPIDVTLSPLVMQILQNRRASSLSKFAFPGSGKSGHLEEPKKCWRRILKRAGLADLRIHDLRRTLGSWQAALGSSLAVIGKSLGHSSLEATQIYSRLELDPVRQSVERAQQAMLIAGGVAGLLKEGAK